MRVIRNPITITDILALLRNATTKEEIEPYLPPKDEEDTATEK